MVGKNIDDHQLQYISEGRRREDILCYFLGELPDKTLVQDGRQKDQFFQENFKDVQLYLWPAPFWMPGNAQM